VGAERRRRAHDGPEVARVGHGVERHDQRRLAPLGRVVEEVGRVGVLVRRDAGRESLVDGPVGTSVELGAGHLEERDAALGRELERLAQPRIALGALGHVDPADRDPRPQCLHH